MNNILDIFNREDGHKPINLEIQRIVRSNISDGMFRCCDSHIASCEWDWFRKFMTNMKGTIPAYLPVHVIPLLLYKRKQIREQPVKTLFQALHKFFKSLCFISIMVATVKYFICKTKNHMKQTTASCAILGGLIGSLSISLESINRRHEITLFVLPRGLQSLWSMMRRRGYLFDLPFSETIIFAIVLGIIHYYYQNDQKVQNKFQIQQNLSQALQPSYKKTFQYFWGKN